MYYDLDLFDAYVKYIYAESKTRIEYNDDYQLSLLYAAIWPAIKTSY